MIEGKSYTYLKNKNKYQPLYKIAFYVLNSIRILDKALS